MRLIASPRYTQGMNTSPVRWLLFGFCVVLGALGAFALWKRLAHAHGSNVWAATDLPSITHSVSRPKDHHLVPDIGYVTDSDHNVVCYFFRAHHWWEGQANLSCVHVASDFLLEDVIE